MKTIKTMKSSLLFSISALVAAAFSGCASDEATLSRQSAGQGDVVPVTATVQTSPLASTRGADGLNDNTSGFSLLTGTNSDSKVRVRVQNGTGGYDGFAYSITGSTAITPPATPPYFPAGMNSVSVYGWYPDNSGSTTFTVQDNQQSDANYCLSDVMVAQPTTSSRELTGSPATWNVTPAELSFQHIMAKMKVVLAPVSGVTITDVKIKNVKKQVNLTMTGSNPVTAISATTDGTPGDITLTTGASITSASTTTQKTLCGVFPAQTITAGTGVLEITASYGGLSNTITLKVDANKAFDSNNEYVVNATVSITRTDESVTVTGWAEAGNSPVNISIGQITDPAAMDPATILKNPLYYVAQYNLATIKGVNNLSGSPAAETTFCTDHNIMGSSTSPALMFTQANALLTKAGGTGALSGWHLPDVREQVAIVPDTESHVTSSTVGGGPNIWGYTSTDANSPGTMDEAACKIAGATVTSTVNSVFLQKGKDDGKRYYDHYAVRFINTDYASAWHYVWTGNGMLIESYMLKDKPTTLDEAKRVLAALPTSSAWQATRNYAPLTSGTPATTTSLCYRYLPACGFKYSGTGAADGGIGLECPFWSSSQSGDSGFYWYVNTYNGYFLEYLTRSTHGLSVRLFRDY